MKDLFLGWLLKPNYKVTMLDEIIFWLELIILIIIGIFIHTFIQDLKEKKKGE